MNSFNFANPLHTCGAHFLKHRMNRRKQRTSHGPQRGPTTTPVSVAQAATPQQLHRQHEGDDNDDDYMQMLKYAENAEPTVAKKTQTIQKN